MVGVQGFEPWTPCSQSRCATRLRYTPTEPIFYTESSIAGKSCKILPMVAYFSSKLTKQIRAALTVALLTFCLLGAHSIGLSHSISHGDAQYQALQTNTPDKIDKSFSHSSEICHLFDSLTLAGFIPNANADLNIVFARSLAIRVILDLFSPSLVIASYESHAPPTLIL